MEQIFITNIAINDVRHLKNIHIPVSDECLKHIIFTGRNGSGKTSVLEALSALLEAMSGYGIDMGDSAEEDIGADYMRIWLSNEKKKLYTKYKYLQNKTDLQFNCSEDEIREYFEKGRFILAYYKAERTFQAAVPKHIEKVSLKDIYAITEVPRQEFVKYLADLKVTEALARNSGKNQKADIISAWFCRLQELLRTVFDDDSLELVFEEETYTFTLKEKNREEFDFNTLSSGFAAVLDIILDLIIRMEKQTKHSFRFDIPGIVLIDEIETHLHLEMQRTILRLLTSVFPNIQFLVSTHSPFILNSISNAVIYDLENHVIVKDGLSDVPYGGIVEGYFHADEMSDLLKQKFIRYQYLVRKKNLTDDDFEEIAELELFLNEIPDYLALNLTTEYRRLKIEFEHREDV